ncbi:hypothetical protein Glove_52g162 [Diversispora epigaea]|uniref:Uncharacterized protein n=1 Tax=Diversispora epigaea TaxID=1348612 RepID=A0A397JDZ8_9GLOM|nr:hypothetical protein Glove_52g162 [Diversispora epigaea]
MTKISKTKYRRSTSDEINKIINDDELKKIFQHKKVSINTPQGLLYKIFMWCCLLFQFHGEEHYKISIKQFTFTSNGEGVDGNSDALIIPVPPDTEGYQGLPLNPSCDSLYLHINKEAKDLAQDPWFYDIHCMWTNGEKLNSKNVIAESKNNRNENFILMVERKTPNPRSRLQENKGKEGNQVRKKEEPQTHDHIEKVKKGKASKGKASEEKGDDDSTDSEEEPQTHDHIEKVKKGKASKGKASEEKGDDDSTDSKEESQTFNHDSKKVKEGKQVKKSKNPQKPRLQENRKEKASEEKVTILPIPKATILTPRK